MLDKFRNLFTLTVSLSLLCICCSSLCMYTFAYVVVAYLQIWFCIFFDMHLSVYFSKWLVYYFLWARIFIEQFVRDLIRLLMHCFLLLFDKDVVLCFVPLKSVLYVAVFFKGSIMCSSLQVKVKGHSAKRDYLIGRSAN